MSEQTTTDTRWWSQAVGYEVYLRSYADGNADGVGDLHGLLERLDHLAWLGIDLVWITPFYPSPMRDHGYDVADYRGVEPIFGDLDVLDACIAKAHELGLRALIDLVPNHSSSDHAWFTAARSARDNPYRDYYIWRDPAPDGGPPNNWMSVFGGPAWTLDEATGQFWLHLFLPEQPDLNWENPAVRDEFDDILRFWLDRGVDGFRIDVAHALLKHPDLPDNPTAVVPDAAELGTVATTWETLEHVHDSDQSGVLDVYRRWRTVVAEYDAVLLGEVYLLEAERLRRYLADDDGLHLAFWFKPLHVQWKPAELVTAIRNGAALPHGHVAWVQGSHDRYRAATRSGGGAAGQRRQLVVTTVQFGLPGPVFVYQGEELGLEDGKLTLAEARDPVALHEQDVSRGRDGCRTPIPWEPGRHLGFSEADTTWLPLGGRTEQDTVSAQRDDPESVLTQYRELIALRHELFPNVTAPLEWLPAEGAQLGYRRGEVVVAANFDASPAAVALPAGDWDVAWSVGAAGVRSGSVELDPESAAILRRT